MTELASTDEDIAYEVSMAQLPDFHGIQHDTLLWNTTCDSLGLTSDQRIFYALCKSTHIDSHVFHPNASICRAGEDVHQAHIVVDGYVELSDGTRKVKVGAGAVIGLAEGIIEQPHTWSAIAVGLVTTNAISMTKLLREWPLFHKGLRGIERCTISRITDAK